MTTLDPAEIGATATYKLLSALVVPRPIAWLGTMAADGVPNLAPFSFFNVVSNDPPTVMVSITNRPTGAAKDSLANLDHDPGATISLVSMPQFEEMFDSSLEYPPEVDEYAAAGLATRPAELVAALCVADAPAVLECRRTERIEVGRYTLNLLGVHRIQIRDDLLDADLHVDLAGLDAVGRISNRFLPVDGLFHPAPADLAARKSTAT